MVSSIRYWLQATGLAIPSEHRVDGRTQLKWTTLARFIVERDPYLEDIATLWLLHLELSSARDIATFWYWTFNECDAVAFSEDDLARGFLKHAATIAEEPLNEHSVKKDAHVFLRTYRASDSSTNRVLDDPLDCPLSALKLLRKSESVKPYAFVLGSKGNLPLAIFAYALLGYRERTKPGMESVSIDELRWAPCAPGRLLLLDAPSLVQYAQLLEDYSKGAWVRLHQTAGLRNLYIGQLDMYEPLKLYYERQRGHGGCPSEGCF